MTRPSAATNTANTLKESATVTGCCRALGKGGYAAAFAHKIRQGVWDVAGGADVTYNQPASGDTFPRFADSKGLRRLPLLELGVDVAARVGLSRDPERMLHSVHQSRRWRCQ